MVSFSTSPQTPVESETLEGAIKERCKVGLELLGQLNIARGPNSIFSPFSLPPLLGDHLLHVPVILLNHHHLNDTHHLANCPTKYIYIVAIMMREKTPAQTSHATPAPPCRPPWSPHIPHWAIGHLHTSLLLHHHLNNDHQFQIALLASSVSIELVSSSARVTSAKFHKVLGRRYTGTHRPDPRDTWVR